MTEEEIAEIIGHDFDKLWALSNDRRIFKTILSLAINRGIEIGTLKAHLATNQAFRGYSEVTIGN